MAAGDDAITARTFRVDAGLSVCRGCGIIFEIAVGAAGQYCSRACYTNPRRANRKPAPRAASRKKR